MKFGSEQTYDEFLESLEISEEYHILAIRSTLTHQKIFLKRSPSDIRINAYDPAVFFLHGRPTLIYSMF